MDYKTEHYGISKHQISSQNYSLKFAHNVIIIAVATHWIYLQYLEGVILNVVLFQGEHLVDHHKEDHPQHNQNCIPNIQGTLINIRLADVT